MICLPLNSSVGIGCSGKSAGKVRWEARITNAPAILAEFCAGGSGGASGELEEIGGKWQKSRENAPIIFAFHPLALAFLSDNRAMPIRKETRAGRVNALRDDASGV
ncbi:MAG: hypothetical protein MPK01_05245 [Gammaproteobacteria bacterium]|nr:hypothetical protein [Gammaproteobacteria bacterium]